MSASPAEPLSILAVEPWLGGSHAAFLEAWRARSRHRVEVVGLRARHWKWRMRAGAWELARRLGEHEPPDLLLASDYVDLPALYGFLPGSWAAVPSVLYLHENQLTYPLAEGEREDERDLGFGFTNLMSCVRAEAVVFNSRYHREDFGAAALELLRQLPRPRPMEELRRKLELARVVAPGVELDELPLGPGGRADAPLRVLFNQRWEHDKDPLAFLRLAARLQDEGLTFELVLLGERYERLPEGVAQALERLAPRIARGGFAAERADYAAALGSADLVLSTARHEFFGLAVVEAMATGTRPLLPRRLAYPEVVGVDLGEAVLYNDEDEAFAKLARHARSPEELRAPASRAAWRRAAKPWSAARTAEELDRLCGEIVEDRLRVR